MKIEVETISDRCIKCPKLSIEVETLYANGDPYERFFRCENIEGCVCAVRYAKEKRGGEIE